MKVIPDNEAGKDRLEWLPPCAPVLMRLCPLQEARKWGKGTATSDGETLDFSEKVEGGSGSDNEQAIDLSMKSRVDADEEDDMDVIADLEVPPPSPPPALPRPRALPFA